jgi:hypothetical protein
VEASFANRALLQEEQPSMEEILEALASTGTDFSQYEDGGTPSQYHL